VLSAQPDAVEELLKQAIAKHQSGAAEAAVPLYEKYIAARPDSFLALSNLGAAYARLGRFEQAITQYQRALKLQPGNAQVQMNLGLALYKTGQTPQAAAALEEVLRSSSGQLQPMLLLADCWLRMGRNKDVVQLLSPIASQRPDDLAIAYLLGMALVRDQQTERGQVFIDRILRNGDSAEARLLMGAAKLNAAEYPAALADLSKAVQLNPMLPDVYTYYGQALLATGDGAGAADAFRKALAANPNDYTANMELAALLKQEEKLDESLALLQRAMLVRPRDIRARYQIASIHLRQGKAEQSRTALEAIVKEAPAFTEAHITLATVYYRLKRKADGDRERAIVEKLTAEAQKKQQQGLNIKQ